MTDAVSYADAVAKSMQLLLHSLEQRFEAMAQTERLEFPQELGESTGQLKVLLGKVQTQLLQMKSEGSSPSCDAKQDKSQPVGAEETAGKAELRNDKVSNSDNVVSENDILPEVVGEGKPAAQSHTTVHGRHMGNVSQERENSDAGCLPMSMVCPGVFGMSTRSFQKARLAKGRGNRPDSPWSEHIDPATGHIYYYNRETKVSVWTKPGEMASDVETEGMDEAEAEIPVDVQEPEPIAQKALTPTKVSRAASSKSLRGHMQEKNRGGGPKRSEAAHLHHHRKICLIDPRWGTKLLWDFFVMFVVLFDALILPFQLAFKNNNHDAFDEFWFWWTTVLFGLDIVMNFNTAIQVDDDGSRPDALLRDRKAIALAYVKGWFGIDFFSTVPWAKLASMFAPSDEGGGSTQAAKLLKVVKFLRLMRLMRMLRMAKLRKLWERVEDEIGSVLLVQSMMLVRILLVVVAVCHWNACIFWMVGNPESLITDLMPEKTYEEFLQVPHWTTISRSLGPNQNTWRWIDRPTSESYFFCFYWTLGVMRTMPAEVTPVNLAERMFVLLFMFFALSAFAISVASLTQAYFKISERSRSFTDELFAVRMLLKRLPMDAGARRNIREVLNLLFERRKVMAKEVNLLKALPDELQEEVERAKIQQHLFRLPGVSDLTTSQLAEICDQKTNCVVWCVMCPGDVACTMGEEAKCAWILCAGRLQALDTFGEVMILGDGSFDAVDEDCLWSAEPMESPFTVTAYTACEMLKVDKDKFVEIATKEEEVWKCQSRKRNPPMAQKMLQAHHINTTASAAAAVSSISAG